MRYESNLRTVSSSGSHSLRASATRRGRTEKRRIERRLMAAKTNGRRNQYRCSLEKNQSGKHAVRIRARFARQGWELSVYFLASSVQNAMKKLEQGLRFLQRSEERLWFWGVDRSDDPNFSADLLGEAGLKLDRRAEFPSRFSLIALVPDGALPPGVLAPVLRSFSQSRESARVSGG